MDESIQVNIEPDHEEICPNCGKMADVYIVANGPDDFRSELRCPFCGEVIED